MFTKDDELIEQYKRYCAALIDQHEAALERAKEQYAPDMVVQAIEKNISVCLENFTKIT